MKLLLTALILALFLGCTTEAQFKDKLIKTLKDNPDIIVQVIEQNPTQIIEALNKAVRASQETLAQKRKEEELEQLEEHYNKPLTPMIRPDESIRGTKGGPLLLVEYSDFECPYCSRAYSTVIDLLKKYDGKIQFVFKHLPLSFHPNAMIAAKYYEAARLQGPDKAFKMHDEILKNQRVLSSKGESFLKKTAQKIGLDMTKLKKDLNSSAIKERIDADLKEASKFGFQGTPGFLLNGVPVKGAYPTSHFDKIVEELKKRGKVNL